MLTGVECKMFRIQFPVQVKIFLLKYSLNELYSNKLFYCNLCKNVIKTNYILYEFLTSAYSRTYYSMFSNLKYFSKYSVRIKEKECVALTRERLDNRSGDENVQINLESQRFHSEQQFSSAVMLPYSFKTLVFHNFFMRFCFMVMLKSFSN